MPIDPRRLRDAATERRCAATFVHTWGLALRGRDWTPAMLEQRILELAEWIRKGAHVADPDGSGRPA
jgi:hypothetical protein